MPRRIKADLKEKGGPTRYKLGVHNKMASECISGAKQDQTCDIQNTKSNENEN